MNAPAILHPDHLLDRARRGGLDPAAWRRLGAHLAGCPACAWEHAATTDFERARADAPELDPARLDALVEGALARAGLASAPAREGAPPRGRTRREASPSERPAMVFARRLATAAMVAVAVGAALALPWRSAREGTHPASAASSPTEANLDAGATGAVMGGDS